MDDRSRRHRVRQVVAALAVVSSLIVLTGCVGIPKSGAVNSGLSLSDDTSGANIAFNPEGPERGASQQNTLRGFVAAFTSATGGYAVAKEFLSSELASKWIPSASVQVRSGQPKVTPIDATTMEYSFSAAAVVNQDGAYSQSSQSVSLQYSFVREDGEWRISAAPNGIVLPDVTFQRIFSQRPIYFLDPGNQFLVPDVRWFPNGTAVTRIVTALLDGPPDWLKGAAFSRFPDGTQLSDSSGAIVPDEGIAKVDLSKEALAASPKERQLMKLQLSASLVGSVNNITSVSLSVDGTPLQIDDLASQPTTDLTVDSQPLVFAKKVFGFYSNGRVATLGSLSQRVAALQPTAATLSSDQQEAAVLDGDNRVFVIRRGVAQAQSIDIRPGLIAPSMDEYGYTWSVPGADPNALIAFDSAGAPHPVNPALPSGSQIVSLEVSREGARVAMLLSTPTGPRLIVAAILRDEKFAPTGLGVPIVDTSVGDGSAVGATWMDQWTVATLVDSDSQSADGESKVDLFVIGGKQTSVAPLPAAQQIVGGNDGLTGLRIVGATDSAVYTYSGSTWQGSKVVVDFLGTQR